MTIFKLKHKLIESDFFSGFIDYHSHIIPGVDDGIKTEIESLKTLDYLESLGVQQVYLTPHVMNGVMADAMAQTRSFASLRDHYKGDIKLNFAAEYMLDSGFDQQMKSGLRTITTETHHENCVLVETSYFSAPKNFSMLLYDISLENYIPIIAHPERYTYMNESSYSKLKDKGYLLQLNLLSLANHYGTDARKTAEYLLERNMYDIVGTDLHDLESFKHIIELLTVTKKQLKILMELHDKSLPKK